MFRYLIVFLSIIAIGALVYFKISPQQVTETKGIPSSGPGAPLLKASSQYSSRIALVIGIGEYHNAFVGKHQFGNLSNPVNDAKDMAAVLRNLGFDVILKLNLKNQVAMIKAVVEFRQRLEKEKSPPAPLYESGEFPPLTKGGRGDFSTGAVGLFYFSGHGFQYNNVNYLIPGQAAIYTKIDFKDQVLRTDYVLEHLEEYNQQGVNIIILDACRESIPTDFFDDRDNKGYFDDDLKAGFTNMQAPMGSLIAYSTGPNTTSFGGLPNERNSVYTKYLLQALQEKPHVNVTQLLMSVRDHVIQETQNEKQQQVPWESVSLTKPFYFSESPCKQEQQLRIQVSELKQQLESERQSQAELKRQYQQAEIEHQRAELEQQRQRQQAELKYQRLQVELERKSAGLERQRAEFEQQKAELKRQQVAFEQQKVEFDKQRKQQQRQVAGTVFRDRLKDGSSGPEMVWIPAGRFRMGDIQGGGSSDEKPVHWVNIDKFAMGKYEVTVGEFRRFVNATDYKTEAEKEKGCRVYQKGWDWVKDANWRNPYFSQNKNHPVVCVSWNDATAYVKWLTQQTGEQYRLPTEAEWEYAARAGTETKYWWGNEIGSNKANCDGCGSQWDDKQTAPVGSFASNSFGLYDILGNVWEWTCSEYENKYEGQEKKCINLGKNRANYQCCVVVRGATTLSTFVPPTVAGSSRITGTTLAVFVWLRGLF